MSDDSREAPQEPNGSSEPRWLPCPRGLFWLLLALITAAAFWSRWAQAPGGIEEILPTPDAREYIEVARRLVFEGSFGLRIGVQDYPSRYPIGFPVILTPAVWLFDGDAKLYPLYMMGLGALSVGLAGLLGARLVSRWAGLGVALLFLAAPLHRQYSGQVMSDVASLCLFQALLLLLCARGEPGRWRTIVIGALLGLGAIVRVANPVIYWPLVLFWILRTRSLGAFVTLVVAAAPFLSLELVQRKATMGSWFGDGYAYWVDLHTRDDMDVFGLERVFVHDPRVLPRDRQERSNLEFYLPAITGRSERSFAHGIGLFVLLIGILVSIFGRPPNDARFFALCILLPALLAFGLHLSYFWRGERFLFPTYPLIGLAAVAAVRWAVRALAARGVPRLAASALVPLAFARTIAADVAWEPVDIAGRLGLAEAADALEGTRPGLVISNVNLLAVRGVLLADGPGEIPLLPLSNTAAADQHVSRIAGKFHRQRDDRDPGLLFLGRSARDSVLASLPQQKDPGPVIVVLAKENEISDWPELERMLEPATPRVVHRDPDDRLDVLAFGGFRE